MRPRACFVLLALLAAPLLGEELRVTLLSETGLFVSPSLQSENLGNVEADRTLVVTGCSGERFWKVKADNRTGWIFKTAEFEHSRDIGIKLAELRYQCTIDKLEDEAKLKRDRQQKEAAEHLENLRAQGEEPFLITGIGVGSPNSAGGVAAMVRVAMLEERRIKYLTLTLTPYNTVGDKVSSDIDGASRKSVRITGPLALPDGEKVWTVQNSWYNRTIGCVLLERADVEYMDGKKYTYIKELPKVLGSSVRNDCTVD